MAAKACRKEEALSLLAFPAVGDDIGSSLNCFAWMAASSAAMTAEAWGAQQGLML